MPHALQRPAAWPSPATALLACFWPRRHASRHRILAMAATGVPTNASATVLPAGRLCGRRYGQPKRNRRFAWLFKPRLVRQRCNERCRGGASGKQAAGWPLQAGLLCLTTGRQPPFHSLGQLVKLTAASSLQQLQAKFACRRVTGRCSHRASVALASRRQAGACATYSHVAHVLVRPVVNQCTARLGFCWHWLAAINGAFLHTDRHRAAADVALLM